MTMAVRVLIVFCIGFIIGTLGTRLADWQLGVVAWVATALSMGVCLVIATALVFARAERRV